MKLSEHWKILIRGIRHLSSLNRPLLPCLMGETLLAAALPYVPVYFSARLIDALYARESIQTLALYVLLTVGLVFLMNLAKTWLSSRFSLSVDEMDRTEQWRFSEKAMSLAYSSIEDHEVAALRERIRYEGQTGYNLYGLAMHLKLLVRGAAQTLFSLSLTLSLFLSEAIPLPVRLALAAGILLTVAVSVFNTNRAESRMSAFYDSCVDLNILCAKNVDYLNHYTGGKDIRLYSLSGGICRFNANLYKGLYDRQLKMNLCLMGRKILDIGVNHLLRLGAYLALISAALTGDLSVGSIAQYVSCVMLMLSALSYITTGIQKTLANSPYLKRYLTYLDIPNDMYQGTLTVEKRQDNEYFVEFRDVSFKYPGSDSYALRHVSLKFKVGEKLAVVGMNGSGKTTFIKLMCRLYDPTEGVIYLNGVDIRKYDYDEYLSIFSVVFQDFRLFSFRLGENVAADRRWDDDRVRECLQKAGFAERLSTLEKGLDTVLYKDYDKDGIEISGGEAQKIALARALYKDAPFIILDEPTSALDPVSEYEVYSGFNRIAGDKTAIYISHRLASCRFCDKIAVFDHGQIIQTGSHADLLSDEDGKYHELWQAQAQYYA